MLINLLLASVNLIMPVVGEPPVEAAPALEGANLIANGGFESGDQIAPENWKTGPAVPGVDFIWERKLAHDGKASLCLRKTAEGYSPIAQWTQSFAHAGDAKFLKLGGWVKADKAHKAIIDAQFETVAGEWSHKWAAYIGAKNPGDPPADHDWKHYTGAVEIPASAKTIRISLQIYGPGTVWFDDVSAVYVAEAQAPPQPAPQEINPESPRQDLRAADDADKRYFLIGPNPDSLAPPDGYKLLLVLPGGDGGADFQPFVQKIFQSALPPDYIIAQLVAPKWSADQEIFWPTRKSPVDQMKFATEQFIEAVIGDVSKRHKIDPRFVFTLSWSSGGPAAYAASLAESSPITGSLVAMSVFKPGELPDLKNAKGKMYYILHSPQDFIRMSFAKAARDQLDAHGAATKLATYEGGHGWHGDVFGNIRAGIQWLQDQAIKYGNVERLK